MRVNILVQLFGVALNDNRITIAIKNKQIRVNKATIFLDQYYLGSMALVDTVHFNTQGYEPKIIRIYSEILLNGKGMALNETYIVGKHAFREALYKPGDILIGCDNVNGLPYGYMGHGAMAINDKEAIESMPFDPIVRIITIDSFKKDHPIHAQFRPLSEEMGKNAVKYALNYLTVYQENVKKGIKNPVFNFSLQTPLHDEWTYIYCTKLIWLSYYYGAGYEFINDHLWFSPEDIYYNCIKNPNFKLMYIHPNFKFHINL